MRACRLHVLIARVVLRVVDRVLKRAFEQAERVILSLEEYRA